jgi:GntR family transcriptional regulator
LAHAADRKASAALKAAKVDLSSEAPLHGQIRASLQGMIANGAYPSGSVLPGEQELARHFKVSRITVKRALNDLALAGFVRRMRGRGTIVTGGPAHPVVRASFNTLLDSLKAMGAETEVVLLAAEETAAPPAVAELLDLKRGAKVQRAVRLRRLKGTPFSHLVTFVPLEIAAAYSLEQLATTPLLTLLERAGAKATDAEQMITAVAAPKEIADALQISVGAPLLHITRVMRDAGGRAVQVIEAHYRPDQFQYHIRLTRKAGGDAWSDAG